MLGSVALSIALLASSVVASTPGVDVFVCSPTSITFTLFFNGTCPGTIEGPGIVGTDCFYEPPAADNTVQPIVSVSLIQIIELNLDLVPAHVETKEENYASGDTIEWASLSDTNAPDLSVIPGGIQIVITGADESGATIKNSILIEYTNNGSVSPIFEIGDQIGWIIIVSPSQVRGYICFDRSESHHVVVQSEFSPARPEHCPAVTFAPSTATPASSPTDSPVTPPSDSPVAPSDVPVSPTSPAPAVAPSDAPVAPSSATPVVAPSDASVAPSSTAPVVTPSDAPLAPPPVDAPSDAPVTPSPVDAPSDAPATPSPVDAPSDAPVTPSPVLTTAPIAPVELETPSPSEMSMSFDYNWEPKKHDKMAKKKAGKKGGKKGGKKSIVKDEMHSKSDGDGKVPKPSTKGTKAKSPKSEKKNEKEGAKEKGDDDDDEGSNKRLRRAAELQFFIV
jgi:hypothetical protein